MPKTSMKRGARTIEGRARAIINDLARYDIDTRLAVGRALKGKAADLAGLVERAERGDMILDLAGVGDERREAAEATHRLLDMYGLPAFVLDAVLTALHAAGRRVGFSIIHPEAGDENSPARLATLYGLTQHPFALELEPKKDLSELLSAVLTHPELPELLEESIGGGINDLFNELPKGRWREVEYSPEYIGLLLKTAKGGE